MSQVFVVRNQHGQFLNKQLQWTEGKDASSLFRAVYRDEALNAAFELGIKDVALRTEVLACTLDQRNQPRLDQPAAARSIERADDDAGEKTREPPPNPAEPSAPEPDDQRPTVGAAETGGASVAPNEAH